MQTRLWQTVFTIPALLIAAPALAEAPEASIPQALSTPLSAKYQEQYLSSLLSPLRNQGRDHLYIDQALIDEIDQQALAQSRSSLLQKELRRDTDGDGNITMAEIEASLPKNITTKRNSDTDENVERRVASEVQKILTADSDGDKQISLAEALAFADEGAQLTPNRRTKTLHDLLALDPNDDGKLTAGELLALGRKTFAHFDIDKNDILDDAEMKEVRKVMNANAQAERSARINASQALYCKPPAAAANEEVVIVSGYEGDAISSVSVAGMDRTTSTGRMIIESGKAPLYIFVTTYDPFIWRIEGDVKRISKFVAVAQYPHSGVGVVGVPKSKVTFLPPGACFKYFSKSEDGAALQAKAITENLLDHPVSKVFGVYSIDSIGVPSGVTPEKKSRGRGPVVVMGQNQFVLEKDGSVTSLTQDAGKNQSPESKADANTIAALKRFSPGGVATIDAKSVIASPSAQAYDVLPQQAGLVQLMEEGKIERLSDGVYYIKKPIARFPAGLAGAHSVKFMLAKGVPMPEGDSGHSCVLLEETGKTADPSLARRCR